MVSARSDGGSEKVPSGNSNAACGIWALKEPSHCSWDPCIFAQQAGCFCCGAPDPLFVSCPLPRYPHVALPLSLLRLSSVDLLVLMLVVAVSAVVGGICIGVWGALSGAWGFRSGWLVRCAALRERAGARGVSPFPVLNFLVAGFLVIWLWRRARAGFSAVFSE